MRMIITGGGTGGHIFPGIAVAQGIKKRFPQSEIMFIGTGRHIDNQALTGRGLKVVTLKSLGLKGKTILQSLHALLLLPLSFFSSLRIMRSFDPDLVFGVGGYVTGPVILAARLLGVASCIHEQNSIPGIANRILGRIVNRIYISIPGSERFFPPRRTLLTGNPVRTEILEKALLSPEIPAGEGRTLLVLGGSLGAHRVNLLVSEAITGMERPSGFTVIHQTGAADEVWVREKYEKHGVSARVAAFFDNMADLYAEADLIVSRAGATTLAEVTVMGKPSLLIPFPHAADDHQSRNAEYLVDGGAALMEQERNLDGDRLAALVGSLLADRGQRARMGAQALRLAKRDATASIINDCMRLAPAAA
jgi:UDP-N-acetylglucosamine--N-acetylmuramyl-(pentapeptide) pyrophosphoryl-undecaprenol N-acetylglucosamine transferase